MSNQLSHAGGKEIEKRTKDRRVKRTRQLLRDALVALILEQGYESVTVQNILDRANLGRSTFYLHYRNKEDLLLSGFEQLRAALDAPTPRGLAATKDHRHDEADYSLALFRHAASYHQLYKAMVGKESGHLFLSHLQAHLSTSVRRHLTALPAADRRPDVPLEVMVQYLVSSLLGLLTWWLDEDLPFSAEEMDGLFKRLTVPSLASNGLPLRSLGPAARHERLPKRR